MSNQQEQWRGYTGLGRGLNLSPDEMSKVSAEIGRIAHRDDPSRSGQTLPANQARELEIPKALNALYSAMEQLDGTIHELTDRLRPIVGPGLDDPEGKTDSVNRTMVGEQLNGIHARLLDFNRRLLRLVGTLEI